MVKEAALGEMMEQCVRFSEKEGLERQNEGSSEKNFIRRKRVEMILLGGTRRQVPRALSRETSVMSGRCLMVRREGKCLELCREKQV